MEKRKPYDLHDGPGYKLALAARVNDQFMDVSLAEMGLTRQMWCVLIAVGEQAIHQPSDIANYIGIKRSALSRTLREMDNKGLLARSNGNGNGSGDGRSTTVSLTDEGNNLLAASLPLGEQSRRRFRKNLSPAELKQLAALLDKLLSGSDSLPSRI